MAQFAAFEPGVEVAGHAILSTIAGLGEIARDTLQRHGITEVKPEGWYSQQAWLDTLKELNERGIALQSVGMAIPDNAMFPPDIDDAHKALAAIDIAYHMNHRSGRIGNYHYERTGERQARLTCTNPYPSDFDYGIIYRMAQRFGPTDAQLLVIRHESPTCLNGDDTCIYDVSW